MQKTDSLKIFTDGGSRGNPGPSAIGAVLYDAEGNKAGELSALIGSGTNNIAEYMAVILALLEAKDMCAGHIEICMDSQLVARQLTGKYKVKDPNILKLNCIAKRIFKMFREVKVVEIPRAENREADALVNRAYGIVA
ncbi:MAG: ribonuclease HI family protein [Candidatus Omnitrophica bacterium]|nr:ribonuclease HI family protein [Candidatus Omnitrophota bacterium]MDD5487967.1 ribonuclease HI family protein [Candidatus Omnitrophota bacterium]